MNYGKAVRIVRTAHGLTQAQLAQRLSIGASQLSLIEAGKRQPSLKVLDEIGTALAVPPHLLTLLASESKDIGKRVDPKQLTELAGSLLELLIASGEQRTLPMKTERKERKRAG